MEQLGIDFKLLIAQIINFVIIVFVLSKLLYKPILESLEKRRREIQKGLDLSREMEAERLALEEKKAKILEKAQKDTIKIIDEAKERAKAVEKQILKEAHEEAQKIIEKGKEEVEKLHAQMEKDIKKEAVTIAEAMTKRIIADILTEKDQHQIIENSIHKLEKIRV